MARKAAAPYESACSDLARRLRERIPEIETAVLARIREKAPFEQSPDPEYLHGFHAAVRSAVRYTLSSIETGEANAPPMPLALLGQARLAARHGITLGAVLCRYTLGAHQISDLIIAEAGQGLPLHHEHLQRLLQEQAHILERVLHELAHEYAREPIDRPRSPDERTASLVKRRLAGEPVDASALNYDFDRNHIGVVSQSRDCESLLHHLASAIDGQLLIVKPDAHMIWAWIGVRRSLDPAELLQHAPSARSASPHFAIGEAEPGWLGWCRTHRQAGEAFPYVLRSQANAVRYADIALEAALETHELAPTSLHQLYIAPLRKQKDAALLSTLRAYFAAGLNGQTAAAALGVSRQTVAKRLCTIEAILRKPLAACRADLEIALRLDSSS